MMVLTGVSCLLPVMRRNPFVVDGCCRKGSRNALQELYNPTEVKATSAFSLLAQTGPVVDLPRDLLRLLRRSQLLLSLTIDPRVSRVSVSRPQGFNIDSIQNESHRCERLFDKHNIILFDRNSQTFAALCLRAAQAEVSSPSSPSSPTNPTNRTSPTNPTSPSSPAGTTSHVHP